MGRTPRAKNKKTKKRSKELLVAKTMPPLYHTLPGQEFDVEKSQVYAWLSRQKDLLHWLLMQLNSAGYIVYNPETGQWTGVDYEEKNRNEVHYERGHF